MYHISTNMKHKEQGTIKEIISWVPQDGIFDK